MGSSSKDKGRPRPKACAKYPPVSKIGTGVGVPVLKKGVIPVSENFSKKKTPREFFYCLVRYLGVQATLDAKGEALIARLLRGAQEVYLNQEHVYTVFVQVCAAGQLPFAKERFSAQVLYNNWHKIEYAVHGEQKTFLRDIWIAPSVMPRSSPITQLWCTFANLCNLHGGACARNDYSAPLSRMIDAYSLTFVESILMAFAPRMLEYCKKYRVSLPITASYIEKALSSIVTFSNVSPEGKSLLPKEIDEQLEKILSRRTSEVGDSNEI